MLNTNAPDGYFKYARSEMLPFVPDQRRRVLEVGCGEGRFSATLPGTEETWGIEPSPTAASEASKRLTRVLPTTFDAAEPELPQSYFDAVICNDVIEHMPDHEAFLRRVKKHIAPGGLLVGSIPNVRYYRHLFQYLVERDWHYEDHGILDRTHVSFFTEKSLRKTLTRCGYDIVRLQGVNEWSISTTRDRLYKTAAVALRLGTFGYFADIMPLQFAFQARPIDNREE